MQLNRLMASPKTPAISQFFWKALAIASGIASVTVSCAVPHKPCTEGGQPARETPALFTGIKRCQQIVDGDGHILNHGTYREWYSNDQIAITGEYKLGKKTGRWIEYNENGKKLTDKYFDDGKEIPRP